jgi:hypothetical protein
MTFPITDILDSGVRANEGPPPSASWSANGVNTTNALTIVSNQIHSDSLESGCWGTQFGPNCEVYTTVTTIPPNAGQIQLHLRLTEIGAATVDGYRATFIRVDANPGFSAFIDRLENNTATQIGDPINDTSGVIANGIKFGMSMIRDEIAVYVNRSGTWGLLGTQADSVYTTAGFIGLRTNLTADFNDFGGGTLPAESFTIFRTGRGSAW